MYHRAAIKLYIEHPLTKSICRALVAFYFNFNSVQLALVLEDYEPPALRVQGFVSRKKGARSMVEEKKEGKKNKNNNDNKIKVDR